MCFMSPCWKKIIFVHDASHIIDWNVIQVEPEEEFLPKPPQLREREEIELRNRKVARVKV